MAKSYPTIPLWAPSGPLGAKDNRGQIGHQGALPSFMREGTDRADALEFTNGLHTKNEEVV